MCRNIVIVQCMGEFSARNTWKIRLHVYNMKLSEGVCTKWDDLKELKQCATYVESFLRGQTMPRHAFWLPWRSLSFRRHHCCIRIYKPPVDWNSLPILIVSCIIMYYQILIWQTNLTKSKIQITWASNYLTSIQSTKWSRFARLTGVLEDVGMIGSILSFLMQKLTKKFILTSIEVDHWTWTESKLVPAPSNVWSKNPKGLLNGTPYHQFQV